MTSTDTAILLLIIVLGCGLVTAWIGSLIAVVWNKGNQTRQFSDNIAAFLLGCVLAGFGIVGWSLFLFGT